MMVIDKKNIIERYNNKIETYDYSSISDGLVEGKLGVILFLLASYETTLEENYLEKIGLLLETVFDNLETNHENSLYFKTNISYGLTGLAYILKILIDDEILDQEYHLQIEKINHIVFEKTQKMISENNFDFLNGLSGNLWYLCKTGAQTYCNQIIEALYLNSLENKNLFYTDSENPYVNGMNYGLAHGYLGLLKALHEIADMYGSTDKIESIIHKTIEQIIDDLDYSHTIEGCHIYKPYKVYFEDNQRKKHQNNRLAWCNSDLTFSYILYKIGYQYKNEQYLSLSEKIGIATTKRTSLETTGIENDHFCHGSAGVALLYKELFRLTRNDIFNEAYAFWKEKTLMYLDKKKFNDFENRDISFLYGRLGALMVVNEDVNTSKYLEILI